MIGPLLLLAVLTIAGLLSGGWAGALAGAGLAILVVLATVVAAATWANRIGSLLDRDDALRLAPRPPGFGPLCDRVYRRMLASDGRG